jgi:hypothetical protein
MSHGLPGQSSSLLFWLCTRPSQLFMGKSLTAFGQLLCTQLWLDDLDRHLASRCTSSCLLGMVPWNHVGWFAYDCVIGWSLIFTLLTWIYPSFVFCYLTWPKPWFRFAFSVWNMVWFVTYSRQPGIGSLSFSQIICLLFFLSADL